MNVADSTARWLERKAAKGVTRLRLFCFPYAGGSARNFRTWAEKLGPDLEVCAIQLPGRERRLSEPALRRVDDAVDILVKVLRPYLDLPFVLFGHSMGAILAYETARRLLTSANEEPRALLVSGARAPHLPSRRRNLHDLPQNELIAEIKALDGTPAEVFEHQDLLDLVLPILRSDFELVETYAQPPGPVLSCPVIAMSGTRDAHVLSDELAGWRSVTTGRFKTMLFDGHHFYLNDPGTGFLAAVRRELALLTPPWPWAMPVGHDVPLPLDRVDCWAVALDDAPADQDGAVTALLSMDERARAERFRFDRHRRMYVNTHAALRLLLARYLQASPASLAIFPDRHGRPVLADCADRLHFNLSHSGAVALVGVSCLAPVGVDVEEVRDMPDFAPIARRYFAPGEVENILQLVPAERLGGFFTTWTRKEAYVKALGLGLSFPLDAFSTGRPDGPAHVMHAGGIIDQDWTLAGLDCAGGYRAALAVAHPNAAIVCRQAPWEWLLEGIHTSALSSANAASTVAGS